MSVVIERHRAFRALLAALAMPGTRHDLPAGSDSALLIDAIYGENVPVAAIVHSALSAERIAAAERGDELAPQNGTMFYLRTDERTPWVAARISGPGIRLPYITGVPLASEALRARNEACAAFPLGIDVVAVDGDAVIAFPRTTRIEAQG